MLYLIVYDNIYSLLSRDLENANVSFIINLEGHSLFYFNHDFFLV